MMKEVRPQLVTEVGCTICKAANTSSTLGAESEREFSSPCKVGSTSAAHLLDTNFW